MIGVSWIGRRVVEVVLVAGSCGNCRGNDLDLYLSKIGLVLIVCVVVEGTSLRCAMNH